MIPSNRILFLCFHMFFLLHVGVSAWTFPLKKAQQATQQIQSKLHYNNGMTDDSQTIQFISTTTNVGGSQSLHDNVVSPPPPPATVADDDSVVVRQMDLPKKKNSNNIILKQTEILLDFELVIGRIAMIASLLFLGGEIFYGISMTTMLSGSIGDVAF